MLELSELHKTFQKGSANEFIALDGLSLRIEPGEFVTIVGANGAGKSTLFRALAGSFFVDSGRIRLFGEDITYRVEHKRAWNIGRLFQDPGMGTAPDMTIEENLSLAHASSRWFLRGVQVRNRAFFRERLARFGMGLEDRMGVKAGLLSGGQRQALALVMATVRRPKLLLLDEHTAALDPAAAEKVMQVTQEIAGDGEMITLMVTHNLRAALDMGNRTLMLERGRLSLDLRGPEREKMSAADLMEMYER